MFTPITNVLEVGGVDFMNGRSIVDLIEPPGYDAVVCKQAELYWKTSGGTPKKPDTSERARRRAATAAAVEAHRCYRKFNL